MQSEFAISIIIVKVNPFDIFKLALDALAQQTIAAQMELIILVEQDDERQEIIEQIDLSHIGSVRIVAIGPIIDYEISHAEGYHIAQAPIVADVEDHVYPEPNWAEVLVSAHREDWAAVGTNFVNVNPESIWSWVSFLPAYGYWSGDTPAGETDRLMRINLAYKREVLQRYGSDLRSMLGRKGDLHERILSDGGRFYLAEGSTIAHLNASKPYPSLKLLYNTGRIYAAQQVAHRGWSFPIRLLAALASPLFPVVRFARRYEKMFSGKRYSESMLKLYVAFLLGLTSNALGNAVGFVFGYGQSAESMALYDMERFDHITHQDFQQLFS